MSYTLPILEHFYNSTPSIYSLLYCTWCRLQSQSTRTLECHLCALLAWSYCVALVPYLGTSIKNESKKHVQLALSYWQIFEY